MSSGMEDPNYVACCECEEWQSSCHPRHRPQEPPPPSAKSGPQRKAKHTSHKICYTQVSKSQCYACFQYVLLVTAEGTAQIYHLQNGAPACIKRIKPRSQLGVLPCPAGSSPLTDPTCPALRESSQLSLPRGSSPPADPRRERYSLKTQCKPQTLPFHQSGTHGVRHKPADLSFLKESTGIDGLRSDRQVFLFSSFRNTMSACSVGTGRDREELITTQLVGKHA